MATHPLQSSGQISMSDINLELNRASTSQISLDGAENGAYGAINGNSTSRPNGANPAAMSEWYGYNHNAVPPRNITFSSWTTRTGTNTLQTTSGTVTMNGTWTFYAQAVSFSSANVSATIRVNGIQQTAFSRSGTRNSNQFSLGTGTYNYSVEVDIQGGSGQGGLVTF